LPTTEFLNIAPKYKANEGLDEDHIRGCIRLFDTPETEAYLKYLGRNPPIRSRQNTARTIPFPVNARLFIEISEDRYNNWQDDESLVVGAMKKTIKAMPLEGEFYKEYEPSDETVREFGEQLLRKTCQEDQVLFEHIAQRSKTGTPTGWPCSI
jgi:N utilization substance protein B